MCHCRWSGYRRMFGSRPDGSALMTRETLHNACRHWPITAGFCVAAAVMYPLGYGTLEFWIAFVGVSVLLALISGAITTLRGNRQT